MKMRYLYLLTLVFTATLLQGQIAPNMYYVQFTDKNNSPYSLNNPEEFLTQRSIQRRIKQGHVLHENDLPVNPSYLQGVAATGANIHFPTKWLNGVTIETSSQSVLNAIAALPYVASIKSLPQEPLKQMIKEKMFFSEEGIGDEFDPKLLPPNQKTLFDYGSGYNQINQINGIPLHASGYRGQGMVIALLDGGYTGVNTHIAFDSIRQNGQILGTKDFVHKGGSVYTESSHGTAVLSTIASNRPGQLIGTAPKASFWLLRPEYVLTEHLIEEYNWVSAAEFADSVGVDIINSSLGYIDFDYPQWNHSYSHMDGNTCVVTIGADIAASKGILVVNSAGNSGSNSSFPYIGAPADGFKVFSIGAVNAAGQRASFSSIGPTFDGRIKPDVMAQGQGTAVTGSNNNFTFSNGTSFSSPVLAGMAACLWQARPNLTRHLIKQAIMQSGNNAGSPNVTLGYGIPDFVAAKDYLTSIDTGQQPSTRLLEVFPNPFINEVKVLPFTYTLLQIRIMDMKGRILQEVSINGSNTSRIEQLLKELGAGVYILNVRTESDAQTIKIVRN